MKKTLFRLWMLLALPMMLGMASCSDDNYAPQDRTETVEAPDETLPTDDQMTTRVSVDLPAAVMADFDEGSTGAALVKRLPQVSATVDLDTRLVVLPGSDFSVANPKTTAYDMMDVARVYLNGGYVALVQATQEQAALFSLTLMTGVAALEAEAYEEMFDIDSYAASRAASHSYAAERLKSRAANLKAATRADGDDLQAPFAEIIIFGPTDYFMQDALPDETTAYVHSADAEGNETEPQAVTTQTERTPYISGLLADAAAEWLNSVEKPQAAASRRAVTRASGSSAINEMMDASETFTYSGAINMRSWTNATWRYANRVLSTVRSWGIHNMESNKDYYYVKQNVTLKMGDTPKFFYSVSGENTFYLAENYGEYNRWCGSFLSQYETSMNLTGSGNIFLEASVPSTDNSTQTTNITVGSSTSHTVTNGISWGASGGANAAGPIGTFSVGGSHTEGTTTGTSFSMSMSQTHKDFGVKKNTSGNKVTWTYNGALPQYYEKIEGNRIYFCHQTPADILVNDCDLSNEICWSVSNPSGRYTVDITSAPQTAALLYVYKNQENYKNAPHKYEYTTTPTQNCSHTLLEPNRATQKWRMYITVDEWEASPVVGALSELESNIRNAFPDLYANVFTIADKTPTSLNTISHIVKYSKQLFTRNIDLLLSYAKPWGIYKYTIHWRCDDMNVTTREGFTVKESCTFTATDGTGTGYQDLFDGTGRTIWRTSEKKDGVWFVEFKGSCPITPTAYTLTTGAYTSLYPTERPKDWKLMAKRNKNDAWTTISTVTNDTRLPNQSGESARYDLDVTGQRWQYFRLEVSATQGNNRVNIGDIALDY